MGLRLAQEAGILLKLPQQVMCTAQNLLHRFYYRKSLKSYDAFVTAMGCLFLASKVEEKPKRLREVLFAFHYVYKVRTNATGKMELGGAMYAGWKESLVMVERTILKELGFSFYVIEHAHRFILFYVKLLDGDAELAQEAWAYCNDSLRTDLQLRSKAEVIACAAVKLAAAKLWRTLPSLQEDGVDWWAAFGVDGGGVGSRGGGDHVALRNQSVGAGGRAGAGERRRNRHRHAIEQASRNRWRGERR